MARPHIDETKVFSLDEAPNILKEEGLDFFNEIAERSIKYLESFSWCDRVVNIRVGLYSENFFGVFLLEIEASRPDVPDVDELIWVVMGNLPPAYISGQTQDDCPNSVHALEGYVLAMMDWVKAVEDGRSVKDLIPVNVAPTKEWAKILRGKLEFIEEEVLSEYQEFLK